MLLNCMNTNPGRLLAEEASISVAVVAFNVPVAPPVRIPTQTELNNENC